MVKEKPVDVSDTSDDSDSDSDTDAATATTDSVTGPGELTLVDDAVGSLVYQAPPELGEEDEGEGGYDGEADLDSVTRSRPEDAKSPATDADAADKKKTKKKKRKKWYYVCLSNCKYESVRRVSKRFGFKEVTDDEDWNLYWTDYSVTLERVMDMKKYQKINHFPGMSEICRKDLLARNMNRMLKQFPKEYNVFPRSWCLPADNGDFQAYIRQKKHKTYILKPESGCQGKGIWVTKNPKEIRVTEHQLCQQYISKPFLLDGFKFDMRIYVLVVSCDPLRIFVFKDGLARFATHKYVDPSHNNVSNVFMHLTNYAINKTSSDFVRDDDCGSKRRITTTDKWLLDHGYDVDKMWRDIDDVIIKTLISAHSILKHNYRTCFPNHIRGSACFEILGFDVMVDRKLKPFLIEVNHSPSFHTDAPLDKEIKEALLLDTMTVVNFGAIDKRKCIEEERRRIKDRLFQRQAKKETKEDFDKAQVKWLEELERYEDAHLGNFRRIYPGEGTDKYDKFFSSSGSLYQETAAFKARSEAARLQREEITRKQEKLEMMTRKKKDLARPESPGTRRKRVTRRPNLPQRKLGPQGRSEDEDDDFVGATRSGTWEYRVHYTLAKNSSNKPYCLSDPSRTLEVIDTRQPQDIQEEEELERISGLLQRDNLVRGLGIVEHVYRLLHCTPGTIGITLRHDNKFNNLSTSGPAKPKRLPGISDAVTMATNPQALGGKHQLWSTEESKLAYNINDTERHKKVPPEQAVFEREKQRLQDNNAVPMETDNKLDQSQHHSSDKASHTDSGHYSYNHNNSNSGGVSGGHTRAYGGYQQGGATYGGRLLKGPHGGATGQANNLTQLQHRTRYSNRKPSHQAAGQQQQQSQHAPRSGHHGNNPADRPMSAKATPRGTGGALTLAPHVPQTPPGGQVLPQYQYAFPAMVKVASPPGGLAIVSAPAPLGHREQHSAGSRTLSATQLDGTAAIVGRKPPPPARIRGAKVKELEMRGSGHAAVYS